MLRNSGLLIKFNVAVMVVKLKCCESRGPRLLLFWWLNMLRNSVLLMFINVAVLVVKCCESQDCESQDCITLWVSPHGLVIHFLG